MVALIAGPPLGLVICKIIGSSNGFMEFVQRKALDVELNSKVYMYALLAAFLLIITMLLPAFAASKVDIVMYKLSTIKTDKKTLWKKYYLDIVILLVAGYGWYTFNMRRKMIDKTIYKFSDLVVDPVLFILCSLFVLGVGLLFLRIYPFIIKFIFWIGRKIWSRFFMLLLCKWAGQGEENNLSCYLLYSHFPWEFSVLILPEQLIQTWKAELNI